MTLKEQWIAALRSGKYSQARGRLRRGDKFCCMGVLCDVERPNNWMVDSWYSSTGDNYISVPPTDLLSTAVPGWEGPDTVNLGNGQKSISLAAFLVSQNDGEDATFEEIADLLESL